MLGLLSHAFVGLGPGFGWMSPAIISMMQIKEEVDFVINFFDVNLFLFSMRKFAILFITKDFVVW